MDPQESPSIEQLPVRVDRSHERTKTWKEEGECVQYPQRKNIPGAPRKTCFANKYVKYSRRMKRDETHTYRLKEFIGN